MNTRCLLFLVATSTALYSADDWANKTLQSLSLREKIGQLFIVATTSCFDQKEEALASALIKSPYTMDHDHIAMLIEKYHIGGIIYLYKSTPYEQYELTQKLQNLSKLPLLITQDCEWGLSMRLYDTIRFPRNMTLGALRDDQLVYHMAQAIGRQCKELGVHVDWAPVLDINNNSDNPVINDRSFGEDKEDVAQKGLAYILGLQHAGVLACGKHFPGHGDTNVDSHLDLPVIQHSVEHLDNIELYPFKKAIEQQLGAIMLAHLAVPALQNDNLPSSLSPDMNNILRKNLQFKGLVATDGLGMQALTKHFAAGQIECAAALAGADLLVCPVDVPKAVDCIEEAIKKGTLSEEELNQRVLKILQYKQEIKDNPLPIHTKESLYKALHTPEDYELKHALFAQAITLVKNNNHALPLADKTALITFGRPAEENFAQSVQKIIHCPLPAQPTQMQIEQTYELVKEYPTITMAFFEMNKLSNKNWGISPTALAFLNKIKANNKQSHVVLFGNPYSLKLFEDADAIVVAYEDDPDAQESAAQVLNGTLQPQGTLPVTASETFGKGLGLRY